MNFIKSMILGLLLVSGAFAQQSQALQKMPQNEPSKFYWGGELGLGFGSYFFISITPMVGYKVSPQFHIGAKLGYSYANDTRYEVEITSHNYGASVFTRYLIYRGLYAHAEFVYWSYKYQTENLESDRTWVPFLLLGGGYIQPVSPNTSLFLEVLWDVLQDPNSPYNSAEPWVKVGVGVGL
jgi:hypothetical protein